MININRVINKIKHKIILIIGNSRHILKYFFKTFVKEPLIRLLLDINKVRHINNFIDFAKAHSFTIAELNGFDINHRRITP